MSNRLLISCAIPACLGVLTLLSCFVREQRATIGDEIHRAESAVLNAIGFVEDKVQQAVEEEVQTLFHELQDHQKDHIEQKVGEIVKRGAGKVKKQVEEHDVDQSSSYPFERHVKNNKLAEHKDHRILHAVESAEHAVLHAIEDEVNLFFHELVSPVVEDHSAKQAKKQ